jgi:hypothetical protein
VQFRICTLIALFLVCLSTTVFSQNASGPSNNPPAYDGASERVDGAHIPSIPNASFSAKAEIETTQILADGTTVTRRTFNIIARDFRGRTHNELRAWIPPNGAEPKLTHSILYDPDTRAKTFVYPTTRVARQFILNPPATTARQSTTLWRPQSRKRNWETISRMDSS